MKILADFRICISVPLISTADVVDLLVLALSSFVKNIKS